MKALLIQHVCFELSCFWHIIGFEWSIHTCMCQNACHCEYPLNKVDVLSVCKQLRNVHVTVYIYDCLLVFSELDGFFDRITKLVKTHLSRRCFLTAVFSPLYFLLCVFVIESKFSTLQITYSAERLAANFCHEYIRAFRLVVI